MPARFPPVLDAPRAPAPRKPYPSDLTDAQWDAVERCVSGSKPARRRPTNLRDIVDAIRYRWTTGCTWRMLPHDFPNWRTVYRQFILWQRTGRLFAIYDVLTQKDDF